MNNEVFDDVLLLFLKHIAEVQATQEVLLRSQANISAKLDGTDSEKRFKEIVEQAEQCAALHHAQLILELNQLRKAAKKRENLRRPVKA